MLGKQIFSSTSRRSLLQWSAIVACALLSIVVFIFVVSLLVWILQVPFWLLHPLQLVGFAMVIGSMLLFTVGTATLSWGLLRQNREKRRTGVAIVTISIICYAMCYVYGFAINAMYPEMIRQSIDAISKTS